MWSKFPATVPQDGTVPYCATVNAKSSYGPYSGLQAYLAVVTIKNGEIATVVVGSIAGGSDAQIVKKMCAKHGLDPYEAN